MHGKHILLVDDETGIRNSLNMMLTRAGFRVTEASNGQKALEMIKNVGSSAEQGFDLLLTDMVMPEMNALHLLDSLEELQQNMPAIVITGHADKALAVELLRRGCRDMLEKPFTERELLNSISKVLDRENQESADSRSSGNTQNGLCPDENSQSFSEPGQSQSPPQRSLFIYDLARALGESLREDQLMCLLYIDLDRFKKITRAFGHSFAEQFLSAVEEKLCAHLPDQARVSRFMTDEFTVYMPMDRLSHAGNSVELARSIEQIFHEPFLIQERTVYISASIGIAVYPDHGRTAEEMLQNAYTAMLEAKKKNRGGYRFFSHALNKSAFENLLLEEDMRHALIKEEFMLHYQPLVSIEGDMCAVEALIRWRHPLKGLVWPSTFIPIAEESGIILEMGKWVLRTACRDLQYWRKQQQDLVACVNISAHQLADPGLVPFVASMLLEHQLPGDSLKLEITETTLMHDMEHNLHTLYRLKDLGVQLAIDDFGTGYSSLNYLRRFPIDFIKIDRGFVSNLTQNAHDQAIVQSIIQLGTSMNIRLIAEGVEDSQQAQWLIDNGCHWLQGYYYFKPVSSAEVTMHLLSAGQNREQTDSRDRNTDPVPAEHSV